MFENEIRQESKKVAVAVKILFNKHSPHFFIKKKWTVKCDVHEMRFFAETRDTTHRLYELDSSLNNTLFPRILSRFLPLTLHYKNSDNHYGFSPNLLLLGWF